MKIKSHKHKSKLLIIEGASILVLQKKVKKKRFVLVGGFLKKMNLLKMLLLEKFMKKQECV